MSYYGLLTVNRRKVEEFVRNPLEAAGAAKISEDSTNALKLKFKQFMERSVPCSSGFAAGLLWGILKG